MFNKKLKLIKKPTRLQRGQKDPNFFVSAYAPNTLNKVKKL